MRESKIEAHLVKRVKQLGGEVRKVQWIGRSKAPDRVVMLPPKWLPVGPEFCIEKRTDFSKDDPQWHDEMAQPGRTIWVELKATGGLATFPANAHERGQWREHKRMREMGQRVVVIDSIEGVEELLS